MGFQLPRRTAKLVFEGDYAGAEVVVKLDVPLGAVLWFLDQQDAADSMPEGAAQSAALWRLRQQFVELFLDSWNLLDNGAPIPATVKGLEAVTPVFIGLLIGKWSEVVASPPAPLGGQSVDGNTSGKRSQETARA
mgnify:CR=1 FL=1